LIHFRNAHAQDKISINIVNVNYLKKM
jgi:hypothetical protein